jgi:nonsense-mediated mRNA decay protein 3
LRQKRSDGSPRKGLILLEMALAKNAQVRKHVISMETTRHGFDFYFHSLPHAQAFSSYLARVAPIRIKTTTKMVSEDFKNNTKHMKFTVTCDMVPLCRDDLILCDKRGGDGASAGRLSGRLCLVAKMSNAVHLVDASPVRNSSLIADAFATIHPEKYWKGEKNFQIISHSKRLVRFVVLDVELCDNDTHRTNHGHAHGDDEDGSASLYMGPESGVDKYALADVEVAREADFGQNDETFHVVTHLGNLLQVGDIVLGYDLVASVLPSEAEWALEHNAMNSSFVMPDIVLVKKIHMKNKNEIHDDDGGDTQKKTRSKSSVSKKREKRRLKDEKKQKDREAAATRMGFLSNDDKYNDMEDDDALFDQDEFQEEKADFERELENDPDLAHELDRAEQELMTQQETTEQEEQSTHDDDDEETNNNNVDTEFTSEETKDEVEEGDDIHN